jgi:hypothetical protein
MGDLLLGRHLVGTTTACRGSCVCLSSIRSPVQLLRPGAEFAVVAAVSPAHAHPSAAPARRLMHADACRLMLSSPLLPCPSSPPLPHSLERIPSHACGRRSGSASRSSQGGSWRMPSRQLRRARYLPRCAWRPTSQRKARGSTTSGRTSRARWVGWAGGVGCSKQQCRRLHASCCIWRGMLCLPSYTASVCSKQVWR